jgi:hypothetical protein
VGVATRKSGAARAKDVREGSDFGHEELAEMGGERKVVIRGKL